MWIVQDNYENYHHHDTSVAIGQVNVQYPNEKLQVQSERRNNEKKQC